MNKTVELSEAQIIRRNMRFAATYDDVAVLLRRLITLDPTVSHLHACVPLWFLFGFRDEMAFEAYLERRLRTILHDNKFYLFVIDL